MSLHTFGTEISAASGAASFERSNQKARGIKVLKRKACQTYDRHRYKYKGLCCVAINLVYLIVDIFPS